MEENAYWLRFLNKRIKVVKTIAGKDKFYSGTVTAVFEDKLILDDVYLGEIPLTFTGMSVNNVEGGSDE